MRTSIVQALVVHRMQKFTQSQVRIVQGLIVSKSVSVSHRSKSVSVSLANHRSRSSSLVKVSRFQGLRSKTH